MPSWHRVTIANPDNGNHWESMAQACYEAGRYEQALGAYRKVDDLGVTATREEIAAPGAVSYRIACCHACLGAPAAALAALADAGHRGYRDVDAAWDDEHLASLRPLPRLADLLGRPHPGLTREQRWRFDADFLVREIERRAAQRTSAQRELLDESRAKLAESLADLTDAQIVVEFMRWIAALAARWVLDAQRRTVGEEQFADSIAAVLGLSAYRPGRSDRVARIFAQLSHGHGHPEG